MKVIGLCGGSGSGKGTVSELFSEFGIPGIDTDAVYHTLTKNKSPCLDALTEEFGKNILAEDGSLDRKKLSKIVFVGEDSPEKRRKLNRIAHKYVLERTREILDEYRALGKVAAIVDAPLLFESGFDKECDFVISVIANENIRIKRIVERDKITVENARARIRAQLPDEFLIANSKYTINNDGNLSELRESVSQVAEKILNP